MSELDKEVITLLQRMQQQLTYLEKKLDTLIQQSQQKSFSGGMNSPRPFRPFKRPNRPDSGHAHGPSHSQGNFAPKKKPYFRH